MNSEPINHEEEQLLGALVEGTMVMLSMMFGVDGSLSEDGAGPEDGLVGSSLCLESQASKEVVLTLDRPTANLFVASMVACDPDDVADELLQDGVGEMVNIIAGNAKAILASSGAQHFRLSVPRPIEDARGARYAETGAALPSRRIHTDMGTLVIGVRPPLGAPLAAGVPAG